MEYHASHTLHCSVSPDVALSSDVEFPLSPCTPPQLTPNTELASLQLSAVVPPSSAWEHSAKHLPSPHGRVLTGQQQLPEKRQICKGWVLIMYRFTREVVTGSSTCLFFLALFSPLQYPFFYALSLAPVLLHLVHSSSSHSSLYQ